MNQQYIVLTNDDGYDALGLQILYKVCAKLKLNPIIIAPQIDCSGCGHSAHFHTPVLIEKRPHGYAVSGTPTDCIYIAIHHLKLPIVAVFSGINHGANLGDDVWYSGTAAGAREAALNGIPALALSQVSSNPDQLESIALKAIESYRSTPPKAGQWHNYNFPEHFDGQVIEGPFGRRKRSDTTQSTVDCRNKTWVWLGPPNDGIIIGDTDFSIISQNIISLTISGA